MANEVIIHVKGRDDASKVIGGVEKKAKGLGAALGDVGKVAGGFLLANVVMKGFDALKTGISSSIALASSFSESLSKTKVVFGESSKAIEAFAEDAAVNLGLAEGAALEATSTFGNFLIAMGLSVKPAADMSMAMVTLAGDMASFNNASPEETLLALRAGLSGEAEPMKRFGVALNEATMKAKAMEMGLGDVNGALTEGEKVQARYAIIMEQTSMAQGDFARTSDGLANKQRIQAAQMDDLKVKFGQLLMPIQMLITEGMMKLIAKTSEMVDVWVPRIKGAFDSVTGAIAPVTDKLKFFAGVATESGAVTGAAAAIIGTVLVVAFYALATAAWTAAAGVIAATWPIIAIGAAIGAVGAAIFLAIKHWDDITAAIGRARDWFLSLPAPIKLVATVLAYPLLPLIALGVGIHKLATNWDSAWYAIRQTTATVVNTIIGAIASLLDAIAWVLRGLSDVANAVPGWVPGANKVKDALDGIADAAEGAAASLHNFNLNLTGAAGTASAFANLGTAVRGTTSDLSFGFLNTIQRVAGAVGTFYTEAKALVPVLGPGPGGVGGAAGGAAAGLDEAAQSAANARREFVALAGGTNLLNVMNYQATITEIKLSDAMRTVFGVGADLVPLWQEQISILQEQADGLRGTGEANDILAEAIDGTIQGLREQIAAAEDAQDALILMGEDAVGPVAQMFQDMVDNIDKATDSIKGLLGIQTQEEAQLNADIAALELEIELIDQLAGQKRGLNDLEQSAFDNKTKMLPRWQDELDTLTALVDKYQERREEGEKLDWAERKELKAAQERIPILEEQIAKAEALIKRLDDLGGSETAAGKAAREHMEDLVAQRDALKDQGEEWDATKNALGTFMDAQVEGRPTMDTLTGMVFAQGKQLGLWKGDVDDLSPALRKWYLTHKQTVWDIMLGFNHLLLNQQGFVTGSGTLASKWEQLWKDAAAGVATALASVGGGDVGTGTVGVTPLQHGGIVTRKTLALLGESGPEAVIPLGQGMGARGGDTYIQVYVQGSIQSERDLKRVIADGLRRGEFRGARGLA